MKETLQNLSLALNALRDIKNGWPVDELDAGASGKGIDPLIEKLASHLNQQGALDDDARASLLEALPGLELPEISPADRVSKMCEAAVRTIQESGISYAECVRALGGVDRRTDPYAKWAVQKYANGSDGDIEIDDTTMLSVGDEGAWVAGWLWVSKEAAGVTPWDDLLGDFRGKFLGFKQDAVWGPQIAEVVAEIGETAPQPLADLFATCRDDMKTDLGGQAANACSDNEAEQDEAISAAEQFFDCVVDDSVTDNVAAVLFHMGEAGERAIRAALRGPVRTPVCYEVCAYSSDVGEHVVAKFPMLSAAEHYVEAHPDVHLEIKTVYDDGSRAIS